MRLVLDKYYTNAGKTGAIVLERALSLVPVEGVVFDPCCGNGAFQDALQEKTEREEIAWVTNDLDRSVKPKPKYSLDMSIGLNWPVVSKLEEKKFSWIVMNPPFSQIHEFFEAAMVSSTFGVVMLANINWMEPVKSRKKIHERFTPSRIITLPRLSYTGDKKTYFMTSALYVYEHHPQHQNTLVDFVILEN